MFKRKTVAPLTGRVGWGVGVPIILLLAVIISVFGLSGFACDCSNDWSVTSNVEVFSDCDGTHTRFSYTVSWDNWKSRYGRPTKLEVFVGSDICADVEEHSPEYSGCQSDRVTFTFPSFKYHESKTVYFVLDGEWSDESGTGRLTIIYHGHHGHTCDYSVDVPRSRTSTCNCENYDVQFTSAVYDTGNNRTAFTYQATSSGSPGLSHFILEIPLNSCVHDRWISGGEWTKASGDPTTGAIGLKFDGGAGSYTFYLEGDWSSSIYRRPGSATTKAGSSCVCGCVIVTLPDGCPPQGADIWVTKSDDPDPVEIGEILTYTIEVGNDGPATAADVVLYDDLSAMLIDPEYSISGGGSWASYSSGSPIPLGDLASGDRVEVLIRATAGCTGCCCSSEIPNTASISFPGFDPDPSNNAVTINTTVVDTTPPDITVEAQDLTVECDGQGNQAALDAWLTAHGGAQAAGDCFDVTWSDDYSPDNFVATCCNSGYVDVTFTATDNCGNSSSTTARFTIQDTTAPTLTVPADVTIECDASTDPADTGMATATDNCCSQDDIVISYTDQIDSSGCCGSGTITRTWSARRCLR